MRGYSLGQFGISEKSKGRSRKELFQRSRAFALFQMQPIKFSEPNGFTDVFQGASFGIGACPKLVYQLFCCLKREFHYGDIIKKGNCKNFYKLSFYFIFIYFFDFYVFQFISTSNKENGLLCFLLRFLCQSEPFMLPFYESEHLYFC